MCNLKLREIFNKIQREEENVSIKEAVVEIIKDDSFINIIDIIILKNGVNNVNIKKFIRKIIRKLVRSNLLEIISSIISYLFDVSNSKLLKLKLNSLKLILLFIKEAKISTLGDHQIKALSEKLLDRVASVRYLATKISIKFQDHRISENGSSEISVKEILKNILRYDNLAKTRMLVLKNIVIDRITIKSIIEKAVDVSELVRNVFYEDLILEKIFNFLSINDKWAELGIFLLEASFKSDTSNKSKIIKHLMRKLSFEDFLTKFQGINNILIYREVINYFIINNSEIYIDRNTVNLDYLFVYCKNGNDIDSVIGIEDLLGINNYKVIHLLKYYELIEEEEKMGVIDFIKSIILNENLDQEKFITKEVAEDVVAVAQKIFCIEESKFVKFIATLIYKSINVNRVFLYKAIEVIFVFETSSLLLKELKEAIFKEIILAETVEKDSCYFRCFYFYLINLKRGEEFEEYFDVYKTFLYFINSSGESEINMEVVKGICDFYLLGKIDYSDLDFLNEKMIEEFNNEDLIVDDVVISLSKILLLKKVENSREVILCLLKKFFYQIKKNEIYLQKYLSHFFAVYFEKFGFSDLISLFVDFSTSIGNKEHSGFVNQVFHWLLTIRKEDRISHFKSLAITILDLLIDNNDFSSFKYLNFFRKILCKIFKKINFSEEDKEMFKLKIQSINNIKEDNLLILTF